jgi:S1-C subfamily serine protease
MADDHEARAEERLRRSVVKLFTVVKEPNYYKPWELTYQHTSGGSGCIIEGNRILTNAHVVAHQLFVQALKPGHPEKFSARVLHVDHDTETALLTVDDPRFFEDTEPVRFGQLPPRNAKVTVHGFPVGGNELCVTAGVISRIEVRTYTHSQRNLLALQTDAAINPGNSGGPVFWNGELVGIAFQSYKRKDLEKAGYVVPISVIRHMFDDLADDRIDGVPDLGIYWQKIENDALREYLRLAPDQTGVRVSVVIPTASSDGVLRVDDVITSIDGNAVACDGTIRLRDHDRIAFEHVASNRQVGDKLPLEILRDGERATVEVPLKAFVALVAPPKPDRRPPYLIFAGIVFTPLSFEYMHDWEWAQDHYRYQFYRYQSLPSAQRKQIVLIREVLAHEVNLGYHQMKESVVHRINGIDITEIADVPRALATPLGRFHVIETDDHGPRSESARSDYHTGFGTRIVLDATTAEAATREIIEEHGIPADRSPDLR